MSAEKRKPRVAFFDFASCEGCQLQIVNLEEVLLDVVGAVDVVAFREAMKESSDDYDIAFVEGSITRESDEPRLKEIRQNAKVLVALGACAHTGCVNPLKNRRPMEEVKKIVYGDKADLIETYPARPLSAVVKVDCAIPGCPIDRAEFVEVFKALLAGKKPPIPAYPVCVECRLKENECVYTLGMTCLGPVTRAGCGARCPTSRTGCDACRGFIDNPRADAQKEILAEHNLSVDDILRQFTLYCSYLEAQK